MSGIIDSNIFFMLNVISGQYDGQSKPLVEYHVKISGFDERVSDT